jgi:hypothetical protein
MMCLVNRQASSQILPAVYIPKPCLLSDSLTTLACLLSTYILDSPAYHHCYCFSKALAALETCCHVLTHFPNQ